ncbi:MAG: DUF3015 family protein [Cellvibrionaceae bacterium]
MKKIILSCAVAASMASASVMAEGKAGSGPNPFSDCGIGAAIFENNVAAAISNVIWDVGTTAVTSATASPETCNGKEVEAAAFIFESYEDLVAESSVGEGEHLNSLMDILSVSDSAKADVVTEVRASLAALISDAAYSSQDSVQRAENFYNSVMEITS